MEEIDLRYMSEEESDDEDDQVLHVHRPLWRSDSMYMQFYIYITKYTKHYRADHIF